MGDPTYARQAQAMNDIVRAECDKFPNCRFLDTWDLLCDPEDTYATFLKNDKGGKIKIRANDKIHFTVAGGDILARSFFDQASRLAVFRPKTKTPPNPWRATPYPRQRPLHEGSMTERVSKTRLQPPVPAYFPRHFSSPPFSRRCVSSRRLRRIPGTRRIEPSGLFESPRAKPGKTVVLVVGDSLSVSLADKLETVLDKNRCTLERLCRERRGLTRPELLDFPSELRNCSAGSRRTWSSS
jgi:hypothetical protein